MPELPEVETIIRDLNRKIKGAVIVDFWSDWPKAIKNKTLLSFKKEIKNKKIVGARRIGKNIFIDLSGDKTLYVHLKMTGHFLVKQKIDKSRSTANNYFNDKVNQYIHHIWYLNKNKTLELSDVRKFAKIVLSDTEKINNLPEIKKLGVDAMSKNFTFSKFEEIIKAGKNRVIGAILIEQELLSGIGNIYRSEILFDAGILPNKSAKNINDEEKRKLYASIKKILNRAVKLRGTSDSDYRDTAGAPGKFQKVLNVYRQAGKKCRKCGTIIKRLILNQRSVFYCSQCQK